MCRFQFSICRKVINVVYFCSIYLYAAICTNFQFVVQAEENQAGGAWRAANCISPSMWSRSSAVLAAPTRCLKR